LDIQGDRVTELGDPGGCELCKKPGVDITRKDAAEVLLNLVKTGYVDWSIIDETA